MKKENAHKTNSGSIWMKTNPSLSKTSPTVHKNQVKITPPLDGFALRNQEKHKDFTDSVSKLIESKSKMVKNITEKFLMGNFMI